MNVVFHKDLREFVQLTEFLLLQNEAANSLMLGLCSNLSTGYDTEPLLITLQENGRAVSAALQTPPFNLVLTFCMDDDLETLVSECKRLKIDLSGVVAPVREAETFAREWTRQCGGTSRLGMDQMIYRLSQVIFPHTMNGKMRVATANDVPLLMQWLEEFRLEAVPHDPQGGARLRARVEKRVESEEFFLWENDGETVTMTGVSGPTKNGIRVNAVYTPPKFRRHGYASSLVAHVSQRMLDRGRKFCFLYTDLSNPTSNMIYQNVGYQSVCQSRQYIFSK